MRTAPSDTAGTSYIDATTRPRRTRIGLVGPGFHLLGGLSVYTCRLANALCDDYDVSVLQLHKVMPARLYPGGHRAGAALTSMRYDDRVTSLGVLDWYWGLGLPRAATALRRARPEILVLQWWTAATLHTYLALALVARALRIPVVLEFHETQDIGEAAVPLVARYARTVMPVLLRMVGGGLVHNAHDLALLRRTYGDAAFASLDVETAPHGPYDHLPVSAVPPTAAGAGAGTPTKLLFFGLIRPYKGVEDLVAALDAMTPDQAAQFELAVVGETWEGWSLPSERIAASPYGDRITFVNRYVSDVEAGELYAWADAVVLPYRRGSASGPLQLAMSAGHHVVLYAVGGLVEAVEGYDGATLVAPDDVFALRDALLELPARRTERFSDPHSWEATGTAFSRLATRLASH